MNKTIIIIIKKISLKRFIARRGRPKPIYSDNGSTFKATKKWLRQVQKDERLNDYQLADLSIKWQFNLSRSPWWGGQFESLICLFKNAFYKTVGNRTLRWTELEEVVIDVEISLNNRPLSYVEDDVQLPLLTPNSMLAINPNHLHELKAYYVDEADLRKRAKHVKKCKRRKFFFRRQSDSSLKVGRIIDPRPGLRALLIDPFVTHQYTIYPSLHVLKVLLLGPRVERWTICFAML